MTDSAPPASSGSSSAAPEGSEQFRRFVLSPSSAENPNGWGPAASALPAHLIGLPFMPFNKNEKLSRISDWTFVRGVGNPQRPEEEEAAGLDDEGGAFSLVDNKPKPKPKYTGQKPIKRFATAINVRPQTGGNKTVLGRVSGSSHPQPAQNSSNWTASAARNQPARPNQRPQQSQQKPNAKNAQQGGRKNYNNYEQKEVRLASVEVRDAWKLEKDIELSELSGVTFEPIEVEDLLFAGSVNAFNPSFGRIAPRNPVNLQRFENRQFFTASTTEDPIINKMIQEKTGTVYATDAILSLLMAAPRSVNSWDILLKKTSSGELIFDKRAKSRLDYLSVNENFHDSLTQDKDSINYWEHLCLEATVINHNFTQQTVSGQKYEFPEENPFLESLGKGNEPATVGFRYRKWDMGNGLHLVARSSLNGYTEKKDSTEKSYCITRALNEFDSKLTGSVDWRQKLEIQTGAVLASEMKNNSFKLARWASEASLSGADEFRLGFISRINPRNSFKHVILMTKQYTPGNFADSVNIKVKTLWGALKVLLDRCLLLKEGKYILLRDPAKNTIHIYSIPENSFEDNGEENGEENSNSPGQE